MGNQGAKAAQDDATKPLVPAEPAQPSKQRVQVSMGHVLAQTESHQDPFEKANPHNQPHKCTDIFCAIIFVLCMIATGGVIFYANKHGDIRKLTRGMDWKGDLCGVDEAVKDKPYLYWCTKPASGTSGMSQSALEAAGINPVISVNGVNVKLNDLNNLFSGSAQFDLEHPICIDKCPTNTTTAHSCWQSSRDDYTDPLPNGTFQKRTHYNFALVQDYTSASHGGFYCMPTSTLLLDSIKDQMSGSLEGYLMKIVQLKAAWQPILMSVVLAIVLGYAYLILAGIFANVIVWTTVSIAICIPMIAGIYVLVCSFEKTGLSMLNDALAKNGNMTVNDYIAKYDNTTTTQSLSKYVFTTGNHSADLAIGFVLFAVGVLLAFVACLLRRKVNMVIDALKATCECIFEMPGMLLFPITAVIPRILYLAASLTLIGWILTVGTVSKTDVQATASLMGAGKAATYVPEGLARSFSLTEDQQTMLCFFIFMCVWGLELMQATDQFVFAYATQRWYFADYEKGLLNVERKNVSQWVFLRGYFVANLYHLGSLALGSFLLALFRVLYAILAYVYKQAEQATSDDKAKTVIKTLAGCCCCCLQMFEKFIRFVNKSAYLIVGLESTAFCPSAEQALSLVLTEAATIGFLEGATTVFQVCGVVSITGVGTMVTYLLCIKVPYWCLPTSDYYVANPEIVAAVAGLICFLISLLFTFVVDMVSDTMLLCYCLDMKEPDEKDRDKHMPKSFKDLLSNTDHNPPPPKAASTGA